MPLTDAEIELQELEQNFKATFDKHEPDGIPMADLQRVLEEEGLLEQISMTRMNQLLNSADMDSNKHITFKEFVKMMTEDLTKEERKPFRHIMKAAIAGLVPRRMREDFLANYTYCPPPLFIPIISVVEIIVFIVYKYDLEKRGIQTTATRGLDMQSPLIYMPSRRYEAWRFFTYMLLHQGYMHITLNIIYQCVSGIMLEIVHKWWRVGLVYLLGVLAGGLAHSISDCNVSLAGASGGVYALLGAHLASIIINWKEMNYNCMTGTEDLCYRIIRVVMSAPVRLAVIMLLVIPDTGLAIYRRISAPDEFKVGVTAHIGGFLAGVTLGVRVLLNVNVEMWEKTLGRITVAVYLAFVAFCILFNVYYSAYPATDWSGY